jgi:Lipoprotein LpqB beta-propeller domain/Sporulation and spore germination
VRRGAGFVAALVALAALTSACVAMPVDGPVETTDQGSDAGIDRPADIVVRGPQPGESASDIVVHFLDAMTASPISTTVAQEFLSEGAAAAWEPDEATIVYAEASRPVGSSEIRVTLDDAAEIDGRGSWVGPLGDADSVLRFPMVFENSEYRIDGVPNALIVPDTWFEQRFVPVSVYFFEKRGETLAPEPVYLPRGDQLPATLVRSLLEGPAPSLSQVVTSFVPARATSVVSVTVTDGVAEVTLASGVGQLSPQETELMMSQFTWTLRQVPGVTALRVIVGTRPLALPGGVDELPIDFGAEFDPTGFLASGDPFGLRDGRLVTGPIDALAPVDGEFGRTDFGVRSIAVDPTTRHVAGVTESGQSVLTGPLHGTERSDPEVLDGWTDLLPPSWDLAGRLWLVDRRAGDARVYVVVDNVAVPVTAPGITGQRVASFTVSRDGTRFAALIDGRRSDDVVVVSRVETGGQARVRLQQARTLPWEGGAPLNVRDLGWSSPTSLAVLSQLTEGISQIRDLNVDGSPSGATGSTDTVQGRMRWLVSSPVESEPAYAVAPKWIIDLTGPGRSEGPAGLDLATLTYVG